VGNKFFDIKKKVDPTPPPLPSIATPNRFAFFRKIKNKKTFSVSLYSFGLIAGLGAAVLVAQANYIKFYPEECSGDWQNSAILAENSKNPETIESSVFDLNNSAVLQNEKGKEISCGAFRGEQIDGHLVNLRLKLILNFKYPEHKTENPIIENPTNESAPEQPAEENSESTSTETALPEDLETINEPAPPTEADQKNEEVVPSEQTPESSIAPESWETIVAPEATSELETPTVETAPVIEAPKEEPTPQPETENASFLKLIKTANAQSGDEQPSITASLVFNGHEHFLDVEYSIDAGQTWQPINDAGLSIPIENVADIENLRVKVISLSDDQNLPVVYLKGMYLEAKFVPKTGNEEQLVEEAGTEEPLADESQNSLLDSIAETISDTVNNIAENISAEDSVPKITESQSLIPEIKWAFKIGSSDDKAGLLGSIKDIFTNQEKENPTNNYQLSLASDQRSIKIAGVCGKKYYTILLFGDASDFVRDPSRSLVNRAGYCESGKFEFTLSDGLIPTATPDGKYYLIVGEQNEGEKVETINSPQELEIKKIQ